MKRNLSILATLVLPLAVLALEPGQKEHYLQWLGCPAPKITFDSSDTTEHALPPYQGKKVLLYGFYSGAFAIGPDDPPVEEAIGPLGFLATARANAKQPLDVVGYSRGFALAKFGMAKLPEKMVELADFPVVNLNNKHGDHALPEPFDLLHEPGAGILIDTNGVICRIYFPKMGEEDFKDAAEAAPWAKPVRKPPEATWRDLPRVEVLGAARDIAAGQVLDRRSVGIVRVPNHQCPEGALTRDDYAGVIGRTLTTAVKRFHPISRDMLKKEAEGAPTSPRYGVPSTVSVGVGTGDNP